MNYWQLPDTPESVKYHGGYDPSDPPPSEDKDFIEADCGHNCSPAEIDGQGLCINCHWPTVEEQEQYWKDKQP